MAMFAAHVCTTTYRYGVSSAFWRRLQVYAAPDCLMLVHVRPGDARTFMCVESQARGVAETSGLQNPN